MITDNELQAVKFSATKKEFYQIWNELLETAKKLSDRWDPTTTNESDPGIVLLKVAAGLADKLFYNIDVNTLSAFMPSASETTAMRKLCEMMGYNVKYYTSATTDVTLSFVGSTETMDQFTDGIYIPRFSVVKDESDEIAYVLLEDAYLNGVNSNKVRTAIEGEVCICESENDDIITLAHLDDNFRYYLPETQIAENGIFIKSVESTSFDWTQVDNLNTQISGTKVFKFGYDSNKELPYIQFPDDVSAIMEDGLYIYYIRTNGRNGNVSARKLSKLERPAIWDDAEFAGDLSEAYGALGVDDFRVVNAAASTNGADIESIDEAYNNYKKIIGTFDTLVTCRDYMNKIYTMTVDENNTTPLVSNVIVSDIRDDINRAVTLCSFNEYGICYLDKPLTTTVERTITPTSGSSVTFNETVDKISCFDLILYPFKTVYGLGTQDEFKNSFEYTDVSANDIKLQLEESKVVSHNIITPTETVTKYDKTVTMGNEIACIKNYLKLKANIKTTYKVNSTEQAAILNNIYTAIYNNFNMRKIDFGEEIPFDTILSVIENADTRIKKVSLDDPDVYSKVAFVDGTESFLAVSASSTDTASTNGKIAHNKLVRRNILAGRVSMFNYDTDFSTSYDEQTYVEGTTHYGTYPDEDTKYIKELKSECAITNASNVKLQANEVIQFRAPNFITSITYPAYVNYYLVKKSGASSTNVAAVMKTFKDVVSDWSNQDCQNLIKNNSTHEKVITGITSPAIFNANLEVYGLIFSKTGTGESASYTRLAGPVSGTSSTTEYYVLPLNSETFGIWHNALLATVSSTTTVDYGMYKCLGADLTKVPGKLVDSSHNVYVKCTSHYAGASLKPFINYYIPDYTDGTATNYGIGITGTGKVIKANTEYQLGDGEHLYINYTPSTTDSEGNSATGTVQNIEYGKGDIIRPNVDLVDSEDYHNQGHSYTKTAGYNLSWEIGGMFAFGADEQVEIRKKAEVDLDVTDAAGNKIPGNIYVYWELNNEPDTGLESGSSRTGKTKFKFYNPDGSEATSGTSSYTLKEGEYFYYTDKNKTDLVYYGPGTEIVRTGNMELLKSTTQTFSSEDVINYGMAAGVPWVTIAVDDNKYITAKEYQYINLAEGDTLTKLNGQATFTIGGTYNNVGTTGSTEYIIGGEAGVLPTISVTDAEWKVHSLLEFNLGPTTVQTLRNSDNVTDKITIVYAPKTGTTTPTPKELQSSASNNLMSLKANYVCQAAYSPKDTTITLYDEDGNIESTPNDFKVRVFKQVEVTAGSTTTALNLHDYGEHWTLLEFGNQTSGTSEAFTEINTYVPTGEFGLIMIQYNNLTNETTLDNRAYLKLGSDSSGQSLALGIYNNTTANTWWNGMTSNSKYYLHDGINIVYVNPNVKSIEIYADANKKHTAVLGDLTLVKGIAQDRLGYYNIDASSAAVQLQADINYDDPDHVFYYNCPIDNSIAIELNTSLGETMADPKVLYDYNNVNNKFVISEIDYSTLKSGITITRDSRL